MSILFTFRKKSYALDFGRKTPWFEQIYLVSFSEITYVNFEVVYARLIWMLGGKI